MESGLRLKCPSVRSATAKTTSGFGLAWCKRTTSNLNALIAAVLGFGDASVRFHVVASSEVAHLTMLGDTLFNPIVDRRQFERAMEIVCYSNGASDLKMVNLTSFCGHRIRAIERRKFMANSS